MFSGVERVPSPPPPHNFGAQSNEVISHMNTFKPQKHALRAEHLPTSPLYYIYCYYLPVPVYYGSTLAVICKHLA